MTEPTLSVRGTASRTVRPDSVVLSGLISITDDDKPTALAALAAVQRALAADLTALGGAPADAGNPRAALAWSVSAVTTEAERESDEVHRWQPTGRITAHGQLQLTVREFSLSDAVESALAGHWSIELHEVQWLVDTDNPAWPELRAEAIRAAIAKGRDYAAALGSALLGVSDIADPGLLVGAHRDGYFANPIQASSRSLAQSSTPSLDPVPQELTAVIEARFVATAVPPTSLV